MTVDLNTFKPGDWIKLRSGTMMRPAGLERTGLLFHPFELNDLGLSYTAEGRYLPNKEHPFDIVRTIPAERITVIEWITDRRPSRDDATKGHVYVKHREGKIQSWPWEYASSNTVPWAHLPGWEPPAPEQPNVSDLEAENAALYGRLKSIDGVNRGPVMPAELEFHRQQLIRQRMGVA